MKPVKKHRHIKGHVPVKRKQDRGREEPDGTKYAGMGVMNIMILTDHESRLLYDYYEPERMKDKIGRAHV